MARKFRNDLTADTVRQMLAYCPTTGSFMSRKTGAFVGRGPGKYCTIGLAGHSYLAHRVAWLYVYGKWPSKLIDHRDGDCRNNAIINLREASDIENHQNTKCRGFRYHAKHGKYYAQITFNKKKMHLGSFDTPELARAAYEAASLKYFGEFSAVQTRGMK